MKGAYLFGGVCPIVRAPANAIAMLKQVRSGNSNWYKNFTLLHNT